MDVNQIKAQLENEKQRLEELVESFQADDVSELSEQQSISELSGIDQHQADLGTETFDRERDLSILEQVEAELGYVEDALERLEQGNYGICEACGNPIDEERLKAMPASRFCIQDQALAEQEAKLSTEGTISDQG